MPTINDVGLVSALLPVAVVMIYVIVKVIVWKPSEVAPISTPKSCPDCGCTRIDLFCAKCGWADKTDPRYGENTRMQAAFNKQFIHPGKQPHITRYGRGDSPPQTIINMPQPTPGMWTTCWTMNTTPLIRRD